MPLIPLTCPMCGGDITINSDNEAAICQFCGKPFIVKDAIVQNYITNVTSITAETVNVYTKKDFDIQSGTLMDYCGESDVVVIPDGVKAIAKGAFAGKSIRILKMPDSVREIGPEACYCCGSLEEVQLSESITSIKEKTFFSCSKLKRITIPKSVISIGIGAFAYCHSLQEISIPEGVEVLRHAAFSACRGLQKVDLPSTIRKVEYLNIQAYRDSGRISKAVCIEHKGLFEDCRALKTVCLTEGITALGTQMFAGCESLEKIIIPDSVKVWDSWAYLFAGCSALKEITIPDKMLKECTYSIIGGCESIERVNGKTVLDTKDEYTAFGSSVIAKKTKEEWKKNGLSTCCGQRFTGLMKKCCSECGKPKDY